VNLPAVVASWSLERRAGGLERTVESARGRWARREGLVLRLHDQDGREGLGEAAPLPSFSRETVDDCEAALRHVAADLVEVRAPVEDSLSGFAAGYDAGPAFAVPAGGSRPSARGPAFVRLASRLAPFPAARFAMETALLDLAARRLGISVAALLAGGAARESVPRSGLLAGADDLEGAKRLVASGLRTLKVKVGVRPFADELARLRRLRQAVGPDVALRLDAGGAWTVEDARERLAVLATAIAPELCEEPTEGEGLLALGPAAVPWAADESVAIPGLADRLLASPGCAALVLKPAFLGGLFPSLALARRAAARGVATLVTHFFDGPVGLAAACELALALPGTVLPCGLEPHPGLAAWPRAEVPQVRTPGVVVGSGRTGLGIEGLRGPAR
jgi:o-succinylbenzoate synthase